MIGDGETKFKCEVNNKHENIIKKEVIKLNFVIHSHKSLQLKGGTNVDGIKKIFWKSVNF